MFLLKRQYETIHNPINKLIWQDWLYEDKFNNNFNIWYEAGDKKNPTNGYLINRKDYKKYFHVHKT
jgi:hypothetical protein